MNNPDQRHDAAPARPGGCLRRRISLDRRAPDVVVGWLEDDFHHFGATVVHQDGRVADVRMAAERFPWTTCPGAAAPLKALIGKPLVERATDMGALLDMRLQCTHVFDLVSLLLVQACTGRADRLYEVTVEDRSVLKDGPGAGVGNKVLGRGEATLLRDGKLAMSWLLDGDEIIGPPPYGQHQLGVGFRAWTEQMPAQDAEYANILRRAIMVSGGRHLALDRMTNAASQNMPALCHSFQPLQRDQAMRVVGSSRNYETQDAIMLTARHRTP